MRNRIEAQWLECFAQDQRIRVHILVMLRAHFENELLTYFFAPTTPTSLRLRRPIK